MENLVFSIIAQTASGGGAGGGAGGGFVAQQMFLFVALFAIIYFMLIRPQQKQRKQHEQLLANLKVGDKIVMGGGMLGEIKAVQDNVLTVDIANKTSVRVLREYVVGHAPAPKTEKTDNG